MADFDMLKIFSLVLFLLLGAIIFAGCIEQSTSTQGNSQLGPLVTIPNEGSAETEASEAASTLQAQMPARQNRSTEQSQQMQQAAIDACIGKNAGDSCTLSFGNSTGDQKSTPGNRDPMTGMPNAPAGMNGTMPAAPQGGQMQQPTGIGRVLDGTTALSCAMQRPN
ncbi:MAG: hypothetical protein WC408_01645 [Candidatus Micrarchaeia archaeon]|jgi:hypothetical protein